MFEIDGVEISSWVSRYLWPLFRVSALIGAMPVIGTALVPARIKLLFAIVITLVIVPLLPPMPETDALSLATLNITLQQIIIGASLGFVLQILFQVFVTGGQIFAMQTGLGFASMTDPANGVAVAVLSQWYLSLVTLLFLTLNGHLVTIEIIIDSFYTMPVSDFALSEVTLWGIVSRASWMFGAALLIALPAVTALLLVNIAFGIMTRAAPQLNIFSLGFPVTMLLGLAILWVTFNGAIPIFHRLLTESFYFMRSFTIG